MSEKQGEYITGEEEKPEKKLTNKERVFIDRYLVHFNASRAAREAGYSKKTAYSIGQRLLKNVEVSTEIQERLSEIHMSSDEALAILADHARGDIGDFLDVSSVGWNVSLVDVAEDGSVTKKPNTRLLKKIKQKVTTINDQAGEREIIETEIELHDPQNAIEKILRAGGKLKDADLTINVKLTDD